MRSNDVVIAGAAETNEIGKLPDCSMLQLRAPAARNAMDDGDITPDQIDGTTTVGTPAGPGLVAVAHNLGVAPTWLDGTSLGGASFIMHVRHAVAAIRAGFCSMVLTTDGESGRSRVGHPRRGTDPASMDGQFEAPYGVAGPSTRFTIPLLRYMYETGFTHEQLAGVAVAQRNWAQSNPRAMMRDLITVEDVFASRLIAYPFHLLECCLVTDSGGALNVTSVNRAADLDLRSPLVHVVGTRESMATPMVSMMEDFTTFKGFRQASHQAFADANIGPGDVDHLMSMMPLHTCRSTRLKTWVSWNAARPGPSLRRAIPPWWATSVEYQWRWPFLHAHRYVWHVCNARVDTSAARRGTCPSPPSQYQCDSRQIAGCS